MLLSVGRRGNGDRLGLENVGIEIDEKHRVVVNESFQTSIPHIYAVGDLVFFLIFNF